jgi:glycosyltransferase involved in cell wall biosynthesis
MIVRNEAPVIRRCLESVLAIIDYWVIVDTGSTDGTQEIVAECLRSVPGELIDRPWVDFGYNRTEALGYARGHGRYVLVIDADEVLDVSDQFDKDSLVADAYLVEARYGETAYMRKQILRNDLPWRYEGVLHEHAICEQSQQEEDATGLKVLVRHDGARARDSQTYHRDAILLETALLDQPGNARYVFYLAQSYRDAGDFELAVRNYSRRVEMGGWREEIWFSRYQIACLHERMGYPWAVVMEEYLRAFQFEPSRAEPLYRIGVHCQRQGDHEVARLFLSRGMHVACPPPRCLFIERAVYEYRLALEYAASCSSSGDHAEAIITCNQLLRGGSLPADEKDRARAIRKSSVEARQRPGVPQPSPAVVRVCLPFRDPGPAFDDCIESLLLQSTSAFNIVLIDDGSRLDYRDRLPVAHALSQLVRNETPIGFDACVERLIADQFGPDDVVIVLIGTRGFATPRAIEQIVTWFADGECQLLYGQHRLASGRPGDAIPASSEAEFLLRGSSLAGRSPVFFRAKLWTVGHSRAEDEPAVGDALDRSRTDDLLRAATFQGTRFVDDVLTTVEAPPIREAARPKASSSRGRRSEPLKVSCLMVTGNRLALAKRAVMGFAAQTHPNRELVVLSDGEPRVRLALERFAAALGLENVRFVQEQRQDLTLGALRNAAMNAASGDIVCQWDDDDCYHPDRIRLQVDYMLRAGGRACFLTDHLHYLEDANALLWIDWTLGESGGRDQLVPGTLMMFKDDRFRYPEVGPYSRSGEDSALLHALCDAVAVVAARDLGHLYLYTYHGRNTFTKGHHYRMAAFGRSISDLKARRDTICAAMAHYPVAKPYLVVGRDGPAFGLDD